MKKEKHRLFFYFILPVFLVIVVIYVMMHHRAEKSDDKGNEKSEIEEVANIASRIYPDAGCYVDDLTDADKAFLENYFYGIWQFEERIAPLCEQAYDSAASKEVKYSEWNFSDKAQQTLGTLGMDINDMTVSITKMEPYSMKNNDTLYLPSWGYYEFENPQDSFLYGIYGGYGYVHAPSYHVEKISPAEVRILNLSNGYTYETVDMSEQGSEEIYHVYYNFAALPSEKDSCYGGKLPDSFYIDLKQPDVMYLDFCGLWKLKRRWKRGEISHPIGGDIYPLSVSGLRII